jgi:mannonate dehydratase
MNREVHVRFWESAGLQCPAPLDYPDEGGMNFFEVMRILRDTQFAGSLCPDHMPHHAADPGSLQAFAFGYGYIKALIQAVNAEV